MIFVYLGVVKIYWRTLKTARDREEDDDVAKILIEEVIREGSIERGVREEWKVKTGIHRKEDIHAAHDS